MKKIISEKTQYFRFFYGYLKYRMILFIILNIFVGVLDGLGLAMFLPLLRLVSEDGSTSNEDLGVLNFIPEGLESIGLPFSLLTVLSVMSLFFLFKGIAKFCSEGYRVLMIEYFTRNVRLGLVNDLADISFKAFVQTDMGRIQNTLTGEVGRVVSASMAFFQSMQQLVLVMVYTTFAVFLDAQFALLVVGGALSTNLLYKQIYKKTRGASHKVTQLSHKLQGFLIQLSNNFKYLKATGSLSAFREKLTTVVVEVEHNNRKIGMLNAILLSAKEPILVMVVSAVIFLQNQVFSQPLAPILVSLLFFYRSLTALISIQNHWNKFIARIGSIENLIDFQKYLQLSRELCGSKVVQAFNKSLQIKGMNFRYGDKEVLKSIDLKLNKNMSVAFVGESGSGKTTLVNVLAGLMPVDEGRFEIDGTNSNEINLATFQSRIGYITQEPVVFNDSVYNNVTFWAEKSEENIRRFRKSIKEAAIEPFIDQLPEGENTELGNNGINLSGGQKQRISIARELYKEIDILIMDEATSALDSETEKEIQTNIDALKGDYTMLMVAHRLSTIRNADLIVLMDQGEIVKTGNFDELREDSARFRNMVELQEF